MFTNNILLPLTQRNILILGVLAVIAVIAFDFENIYRQLCQIQKTLSLKVTRMLLKVKKKTRDKGTASTASMKLEAKQVCTQTYQSLHFLLL